MTLDLGKKRAVLTIAVCGVLLATFWIRAAVAVSGKSSTYDEPMHTLGAWVHRHYGDFRINYEDPPLWHYWAATPNGEGAIKADFASGHWTLMPREWNRQWFFTYATMYRAPIVENDPLRGERMVARSRQMMLALGAMLGALLAWWGWQIAGAAGAIAAAVLYGFDPNFLAHSPLVKNDVAISLCVAGLVMALWRAGRRVTPFNVAGIATACAAAMTTKFTGVVLAPVLVTLLLLVRSVIPVPWAIGSSGILLATRWWERLLASIAIGVVAAVVSYTAIWLAYGLRFTATPDQFVSINTQETLDQARITSTQAWMVKNNLSPEKDQETIQKKFDEWKASRSIELMLWLKEKRLFPEAFLNGLIFVEARSYIRGSYLDGEVSIVGFRSYFPKAMFYKTALGTMGALVAAGAFAAWFLVRSSRTPGTNRERWWARGWLAACLLVPVALYMTMSMSSNLNIGLRHVLPVYPFLFVAVAWATNTVNLDMKRPRLVAGVVAGLLSLVLAIESLSIAPDYLTFFNAIAGGQRGGLEHLADSNLDWGQDLPLLAEWQKNAADAPLYLSYFGMADPAAYGIKYLNLPGGYELNPNVMEPPQKAVLAISATKLQGVYASEQLRALYDEFRVLQPTAVLGGTIYIYDFRQQLKRRE